MKASEINYLLDAGPMVGFLDADDQWHRWSVGALETIDEPLATTESVVTEACHHLRRLRPALVVIPRLVREGRLRIVPMLAVRLRPIEELPAKYPRMDLGDASMVVLSECCPRARLVTVDSDFQHYRRFRHQPIPVLAPEPL